MFDTAVSQTNDRDIVLSRVIRAPRARVFEAWTTPEAMDAWWGPDGFRTTTHEMDVRPGGTWRFIMHGPDGRDYPNRIDYTEVVKPERIAYAHCGDDEHDDVHFHAEATFEDVDGHTRVTLRMEFPAAADRERVVKEYGAIEGGQQTLSRLAAHVERALA